MGTVGERIKMVREYHELSQAGFADALKLSRGYITSLEHDVKTANDRILRLICVTFHVNENWLRTGDGNMRADQANASETIFQVREMEYAKYFLQIQRAMAPSCEYEHQIIKLFQMDASSDIFNYIASRLVSNSADQHEADRVAALFQVAFPDYKKIVDGLRKKTKTRVALMEQSRISRLLEAPVAGYAAAGRPLNDNTADIMVPIPEKYLDGRFFVVQARGDSMIPKIYDGDFVVVQKNIAPEPGALALVSIEGMETEYTIKLLTYDNLNDEAILRSYNPQFKPIVYPCGQIIKAERVVHIVHK